MIWIFITNNIVFSVHVFPLANLDNMSIKILMKNNYDSFKTEFMSIIFLKERKWKALLYRKFSAGIHAWKN